MIIPTQQMRKQRPREFQACRQGHTAGRVQGRDWSPSAPDSRAQVPVQHMPTASLPSWVRNAPQDSIWVLLCSLGARRCWAGGEGMLREGPGLRPGGTVAQAGHSPCSGGSHVVSVHLLVLQKPRLLWDCKRTSGQNEKGDMDQKLRTKKGQWLGGHRRAM